MGGKKYEREKVRGWACGRRHGATANVARSLTLVVFLGLFRCF